MNNELPDELDRLYARLEWENPRSNFVERVAGRIEAVRRIERISSVASFSALIVLGFFAFTLGRGLTLSGTLDYLGLLLSNLDIAMTSADEFVVALFDAMPWVEIAAVSVGVTGVWLASVALPRSLTGRKSKAG